MIHRRNAQNRMNPNPSPLMNATTRLILCASFLLIRAAHAAPSLILSDQPGWNGWSVMVNVRAGFREHGGTAEVAATRSGTLNIAPFGTVPGEVFTLPDVTALRVPGEGASKDKASGAMGFSYKAGSATTDDKFDFTITTTTSAVSAKQSFAGGPLVPADAFVECDLYMRTFAPVSGTASLRIPDLPNLTSPDTEAMLAVFSMLPAGTPASYSGFTAPGDPGFTLPMAMAPGASFEYHLHYEIVTPYGEDPETTYTLVGTAADHPAGAVPGGPDFHFEAPGPLGPTVVTSPGVSSPAAASGWQQHGPSGSHLITQVQPSAASSVQPGGCGDVMAILTDGELSGSGGNFVSAVLAAPLPVNSRGWMDIRVSHATVRYGFLVTDGADVRFEENNLVTNNGLGAWQRVSFTNPTLPSGSIALQVSAVPGQEAQVEIDNVTLVAFHPEQVGSDDFVDYFGPSISKGSGVCLAGEIPVKGDFNGDGLDDIATFVRNAVQGPGAGDVYISLNQGGAFAPRTRWAVHFCINNEIPDVGDFNGDGLADIITFVPDTGKVWVALNTGGTFGTSREWFLDGPFFSAGSVPAVGDFDGDSRSDIVAFKRVAIDEIGVALSDGSCFGSRHDLDFPLHTFCPGTAVPRVGDVDGDGRDEFVSFLLDSATGSDAPGDVLMAGFDDLESSGFALFVFLGGGRPVRGFATSSEYTPFLSDLNGDGRSDLLAVSGIDGHVVVALKQPSHPESFVKERPGASPGIPWQWARTVAGPGEMVLPLRFNGDLNMDLVTFPRGLRPAPADSAALVSLCGGHAEPEPDARLAEFGWGTMGPGTASGPVVRPLLVIVSECAGSPIVRTLAQYDQGMFGPQHPNVAGWFSEMSNGAFTFSRANVVRIGPYACPLPDLTGVRTQLEDAANFDGPGGFEFRDYDTNADGILSPTEMGLLGISSFFHAGGQTFPVDATIFPGTAREIRVALKWAFAGDQETLSTMAHELCHAACGMVDLYGSNCRGMGLTLASCTAGATAYTDLVHLDPWHKIRMGWVKPLIYDIRDHPAGAAIRPPQFPGERPVILFDSSRGTHEFHILEHRNAFWNRGTQTWTEPGGVWRARDYGGSGIYAKAGYDVDMRATDHNSFGNLIWAVKTNPSNDVLDIPQRVNSGANHLLDSPVLGDDFLYDVSGGPDPQIHCGPDGILQSVAQGDDGYWSDALCLPVPNPSDMLARDTSSLSNYNATLTYYDSTNSGVKVKGDNINYDENWQFMQWGREFHPFIKSVVLPGRPVHAGDRILLSGSLGGRTETYPYIIVAGDPNPFHQLNIVSWTGIGAIVEIPHGIPSGTHRLVLGDRYDPHLVSNSWPITVKDGCDLWREEHFNAVELANPAISGELADPDQDGQSNLEELFRGTDPRHSNPPDVRLETFFDADPPIIYVWYRDDLCAGLITLEYSTDLVIWYQGSQIEISGTRTRSTPYMGVLPFYTSGQPRFFTRLRFTRL